MITLDSGNVLLKPSNRKQMMGWLRRIARLGARLGDFALKVTLRRTGRILEASASVHDSAGDFGVRSRQHNWRHAMRELVRLLSARLCMQRLTVG